MHPMPSLHPIRPSRRRATRRLLAAPLVLAIVATAVAVLASPAAAAQEAESPIQTVPVADGVWMLVGPGGNIGVSAGADGVFLIDDEVAPVTAAVRAAVAAIQPGPIRFVLNTHWHPDHTGGNENLGEAGAVIVAHDNVRETMRHEQVVKLFDMTVPASPPVALPVITFDSAVTFHLNGDEIRAHHVRPAHTDGDSVVHFQKADVVHTGDVYFNGLYPVIDVDHGGSIDGTIAVVEHLAAHISDSTRVIPGHGPLSDRAGLVAYGDMLRGVRGAVAAQMAEGKDRAAVVAAKPTAPWDADWGQSVVTPDAFAGMVYDSLAAEHEHPHGHGAAGAGCAHCRMGGHGAMDDCPMRDEGAMKDDCPMRHDCPMKGDGAMRGDCPMKGDCAMHGDCAMQADCPMKDDCPMKGDGSMEGDCPMHGGDGMHHGGSGHGAMRGEGAGGMHRHGRSGMEPQEEGEGAGGNDGGEAPAEAPTEAPGEGSANPPAAAQGGGR